MIFIGIDDTDNKESGGTGRVAREIAAELRSRYSVLGVSRHQLLVDDRVPYTSNNSCNVIHVQTDTNDFTGLAEQVRPLLEERCLLGSDPGLCIADGTGAEHPLGKAVQTRLASQPEAFEAARSLGAILTPCGGTNDGVIGAMAGVILAASGNDGRFVDVGQVRQLEGVVSVKQLLASGVSQVVARDGTTVTQGRVDTDGGRVRPCLIEHQAVLRVEPSGENCWKVIEQGKGGYKRKEQVECKPSR